MKLPKPDIGVLEELDELPPDLNDEIVSNKKINGACLTEADLSGMVFEKVIFEKCRFPGDCFSKCHFSDVIFNACDLSNCDFRSAYFARCEMSSVKGIGANMAQGFFAGVAFGESNFRFANFDSAKFDKVVFTQCDLTEALLSNCIFKAIEFDESELNRTTILHTSFNGLDLSNCNLQSLLVSNGGSELRGLTVNMFQAADLARLLGLKIK